MEKLEKFNFVKEDGTNVEANVIGCFTVEETGKTYLIYSVNDGEISASLVIDKGNVLELTDISDEDEFAVEKIISEFINEEEA